MYQDIRQFFKTTQQKKSNLDAKDFLDSLNIAEKVSVFTDGCSLNNGSKTKKHFGGIGIFFGDNDPRNQSIKLEETKNNPITNNKAELKACIKAIEIILKTERPNVNITIYTDSEYTINCITKWAKGWKINDWKKTKNGTKVEIKNKDLIITLFNLYNKYSIKFKHVKAHRSKPNENSKDYYEWYGNYMADKLANQAAK